MAERDLSREDRGVTPVIGIILVVAIVVILSSVIAVYVLDLGQQTQSAAPGVNFSFEYSDGVTGAPCTLGSEDGELQITFKAGTTINEDRLSLKDTNDGSVDDLSSCDGMSADSDIQAGDSFTVGVASDETTLIIWTSPSEDTTAIIGEFEGPDS